MSEFSKTTYNYNDRIKINDVTTNTNRYVLLNVPSILDTLIINTEDEKPSDVGVIDYGSKTGKGAMQLPVTLYGSSVDYMNEMIQVLKEAFNPDLLELDATYGSTTAYNGYHPLDWTETVGATSRAFRIYTKAEEIPQVAGDVLSGRVRKATVKLKIQDPRKYLQTETTLAGAGAAVNAGTFTTPITITVTASGATSTSLQITNSTTSESIYVSTALSAAQVLVINTGTHSCTLDGVEKRSMLSGSTSWWKLNPGSNTLAITNGTNASVAFAWRSAWPL
jgi:hypothetical protein